MSIFKIRNSISKCIESIEKIENIIISNNKKFNTHNKYSSTVVKEITEIEKIIRFGINSNEPSRGYPYPQGLISRLAALSETVGLGDRSPSKQSEEVYKKLNKTTIEFSNKIEKLSKETR